MSTPPEGFVSVVAACVGMASLAVSDFSDRNGTSFSRVFAWTFSAVALAYALRVAYFVFWAK